MIINVSLLAVAVAVAVVGPVDNWNYVHEEGTGRRRAGE